MRVRLHVLALHIGFRRQWRSKWDSNHHQIEEAEDQRINCIRISSEAASEKKKRVFFSPAQYEKKKMKRKIRVSEKKKRMRIFSEAEALSEKKKRRRIFSA
jgi:hypothetical protein